MFPAAGDGCFYVGLGGKSKIPNPSYEPYQCCPRSSTKQSKVPKMSPVPKAKQVTSKPSRPAIPAPPTPKPFATARKDAKTPKSPPPKAAPQKVPLKPSKDSPKEKNVLAKPEKGKGKKGFFGTGKYIWWW